MNILSEKLIYTTVEHSQCSRWIRSEAHAFVKQRSLLRPPLANGLQLRIEVS